MAKIIRNASETGHALEHMYFKSRRAAGEQLADQLYDRYRYEDCAVVSLSSPGVLVGEPIAERLHALLTMIVTENISLPGDNLVVGTVSSDGDFVYDNRLSSFEIQDYFGEFFHSIDDQKRVAFHKINRLIGDGGAFDKKHLQNRNIILVSDGLIDGSIIGAAIEYLKPVKVPRLIIAVPIVLVSVVDFIHVKADEVHVLDVKEFFIDGLNHYYDDNEVPSDEDIVRQLNESIKKWRK